MNIEAVLNNKHYFSFRIIRCKEILIEIFNHKEFLTNEEFDYNIFETHRTVFSEIRKVSCTNRFNFLKEK